MFRVSRHKSVSHKNNHAAGVFFPKTPAAFVLFYENVFKQSTTQNEVIHPHMNPSQKPTQKAAAGSADAVLAERIRRGEAAALDDVVSAYAKLIWTVIAGILGQTLPREDLEECAADVLIELWQHIDRFDASRGTLKAYLCRMARSRAIDRLRAAASRQTDPLDADLPASDDDPTDQIVTRDTFAHACRIMDSFPPDLREIVRLRFLFELTPAEIALRLNLPVESVYAAVRRGKDLLRAELSESEPSAPGNGIFHSLRPNPRPE